MRPGDDERMIMNGLTATGLVVVQVVHPLYQLTNFNGHRTFGGRDITYLICHVISQDHEIKGS